MDIPAVPAPARSQGFGGEAMVCDYEALVATSRMNKVERKKGIIISSLI